VAEVDFAQPGYTLKNSWGKADISTNVGIGGVNTQKVQPKMKVKKILIHPGEINNFKSSVKNKRMIASHSDQHEIYIWDINLQQCV
jgi:hypothetical protein